jgi:putative FmdB family regulatory protein
MPIYTFDCPGCKSEVEELRKIGDCHPPKCPKCGTRMERKFAPIITVFKGPGWNSGTWSKLRRRAIDQGDKFFRRHPDKQTLVREAWERHDKEVGA